MKKIYIMPNVKVLALGSMTILAGSNGDADSEFDKGNKSPIDKTYDDDESDAKGFNSAWTTWDD